MTAKRQSWPLRTLLFSKAETSCVESDSWSSTFAGFGRRFGFRIRALIGRLCVFGSTVNVAVRAEAECERDYVGTVLRVLLEENRDRVTPGEAGARTGSSCARRRPGNVYRAVTGEPFPTIGRQQDRFSLRLRPSPTLSSGRTQSWPCSELNRNTHRVGHQGVQHQAGRMQPSLLA